VTLPSPALLVITDRRQCRLPLAHVIEQACLGGCRWISLREKDLPAGDQLAQARLLLPIVRRFVGARLSIHGDATIAAVARVDGLHLAAGSDPAVSRRIVGRDALVGISVHSAEEAASLDRRLVDYVIAGPAFETASKPGYGPALGATGIAAIARASAVPVIAIGGIEPVAIPALLSAGAAGIALMGSVMRAPSPATVVRRALAAFVRCAAPQP
jgi:thiamine-phosphate pyrophosphorylase